MDPASRVQRGCGRTVSPREDCSRLCGDGRRESSPEKYYGLYWGIWRVAGRGFGTTGGDTENSSIRAASTRPVRVCSVRQQPGVRGGKGKGAFTWLCRDGSRSPGSASHLEIASPPPSSTQFGPPVP